MTTDYCKLNTLNLVAKRNWRGVSTLDLVVTTQEAKELLELWQTAPQAAADITDYQVDKAKLYQYYYACMLADCGKEIIRRRSIAANPHPNTDKEIIQAIKEALPVADVIEGYTKVYYSGRDTWKFHCTLHGEDRDPSGVIYNKEQCWWCFGCNKGGDVFDAVQVWEKVDLKTAIAKLAKQCGLSTKPLIRKPIPQVRGGAEV